MGRSGQRRPADWARMEARLKPFLHPRARFSDTRLTRIGLLEGFALAVVGLRFMGICDDRKIAELLMPYCSKDKHDAVFEATLAKVGKLTSALDNAKGHPVVDRLLQHGPPATCAVELPNNRSVRCSKCRGLVRLVPCVACTDPSLVDERIIQGSGALMDLDSEEDSEELPPPKWPTDALPGSPEKIEVMRARVALGFSPFHSDDRVVN